jgi:hypothetical protein
MDMRDESFCSPKYMSQTNLLVIYLIIKESIHQQVWQQYCNIIHRKELKSFLLFTDWLCQRLSDHFKSHPSIRFSCLIGGCDLKWMRIAAFSIHVRGSVV